MKRLLLVALAFAVAAADLVPVALLLKQAWTPERESFAWPPTWLPHEPTLANFHALAGAVELARGFWLSVLVAGLTTLAVLALAAPAAWVAARRPRVGHALDGAMLVTRLFPTIALAVPLATLFVGLGLYNHPAGVGLWLAHTLLGLPLGFLVLRAGFAAVPPELEEAARLDGAGAAGAVLRVTVPLAAPSVGVAALLVFLVSWDEFGYALLLQVTNRPLPPLLYYFAAFGHPGVASAIAAVMLVPALAVILVLEPAWRSGALTGSGR
jgi:multiple sugar transport system permease protein